MKDIGRICIFLSITVTQGLALMCLQCVNVIQPRHCHGITYCADNEVCYVEKVISSDGVRYNTGCMLNDVCSRQNASSVLLTSADGLQQTFACTHCCNKDLCNSEGCGEPGIPSDRGPMCFDCSQIRNATQCRTITYCRPSEVCHVTEEVEFGESVYSTGCVHSQLCSGYASRPSAISDLSSWHQFTRANPGPATSELTTTSTQKPTSTVHFHMHSRHTTMERKTPAPPMVPFMKLEACDPRVVVVGRSVNKRYVDCSQCCYGDLCNYQCPKGGMTTTSTFPRSTLLPITTQIPIIHSSGPTQQSTQQFSSNSNAVQSTSQTFTSTNTMVSSVSTNFPASQNTTDTTGQEFLLAFSKHENGNDADNITLLVTSPSNGQISIYSPENNVYMNTTLTKGENVIEIDPHLTLESLLKENKSVHIVTDVNVTVHVQEYRNVFDSGFLALPVQCLSTKYVVSTEAAFNGANPAYISVAALKDNTDISFKLKLSANDTIDYQGKSYGDGEFLFITLNKYETFQIAQLTDFTGTVVQSSKPISVISGNTATVVPKPLDSSKIFDAQTLTQMIPPASSLGQHFIVPNLQDRHSFYYKIVASLPNTHVMVDSINITLPNEGSHQTYESLNGRSVNISSDKPVLVVQVPKTMQSHFDTASGAMIVTPSVEQFKSDYDVIIPDPPKRNHQTAYKSYISIITESDQIDNIIIDGKRYDAYNSNLQTVHLDGKSYSVITLQMDNPGVHKLTSATGSPFGLITYGFDFAQGYGYPVGLKC